MSVVYFVQAARSATDTNPLAGFPRVHAVVGAPWEGHPIKIGFSTRLHRRLLTISSAAKARVWLVGAVVGGFLEEQRIHRMFEHLRLRAPFAGAGTEWFAPAWELTNFIVSLPAPPLTDTEYTKRSIKARAGATRLDLVGTS